VPLVTSTRRTSLHRLSLVSALAFLPACSGLFGDEEKNVSWTPMEGAPYAVTRLSFDGSGAPIVMGASATFGEYFLQRPRPGDGLWERAEGLPIGGHGDPVFRVGDTVYAVLQRAVVRLDDEASFTWTPLGNPINDGDSGVQILGLSTDEVLYASTYRQVDVDGVAVFRQVALSWSPGQTEWTLVPGSQNENSYWTALVDPTGRLVYSTGDGFYRGDANGVVKIFDCEEPDYLYCEAQISSLVADAEGNLTFYICPYTTSHRAVYRLPAAGGVATLAADIGDEYFFCRGIQGLPDGTVYLHIAEDNLIGSSAALFRLAPGGSSLELVADGLESDYAHVVRDASTLFRFGDAAFVTGVAHRGI
jgi:hypothetical protein